jgi:hypothetical protein
MNRLRACAWLSLLIVFCAACADDDVGGDSNVPLDIGSVAKGAGGSSGRAASGSGAGGARASSGSANGNDPDSPNSGSGGRGRSGGADAGEAADSSTPVSTGEGTGPEAPKGSPCMGGHAEFDHHSAHCGSCANACAPVVIASGLDWPTDVVLDATHAYVITSGNEGKVLSIPLDGGDPVKLADQVWPMAIAIDATDVYWTNGQIYKLPLTGGTPTALIPNDVFTSNTFDPHALAVDDHDVYWVQPGADDLAAVMKVSKDGGTPVTLATIPGSDPDAIAIDDHTVYWANGSDSMGRRVMKVSKDGGDPITLATGAGSTFGFGIDATSAYWTTFVDASTSAVMKAPLAGGAATMLASGTAQPMDLAVDGVSVYWTNASTSQTFSGTPGTDGTVMAVPRAGGETITIGPDQEEPGGIAANGTTVCWTNTGMGQGTGTVKCLGPCASGMCR